MPPVMPKCSAFVALMIPLLTQVHECQGSEPIRITEPLEVLKHGQGPKTLLIIPCMSCSANAWQEFMDRHQTRYSMYAVTIPGYGGTPVPNVPMNTSGTPWRENALEAISQFIDREKLDDVTVIGHSWGTMVAVQLAAKRPDVVMRLVAVDGSIESTSWVPDNPQDRLQKADEVIGKWGSKLQDAEQWRKFNRVYIPNTETVTRDEVLRTVRLHGSFMATPRNVALQYWRENMLVNLTADLKRLTIPILDIKTLRGQDQAKKRREHLADLQKAGAPKNVRTIFLHDTRHFVEYHRPELFDRILEDFIHGYELGDFKPEK